MPAKPYVFHYLLLVVCGGFWACQPVEDPPPMTQLVYLPDSIPLQLQWIPAGTFTMGSPNDEPGRDADEGPPHRVSISKGFYIGTYEVTQIQWEVLMNENPAVFRRLPDAGNRPVESVSWQDCQKFLRRLNGLNLGDFRLPTEAEWEYACRAGASTAFYWGDDRLYREVDEHAWVNSRSYAMTHPVGQKKPNAWGLYDMSGNVWEWCSDWYAPYPSQEEREDPQGPSEGKAKVFRGGSWYDFPVSQRSANRHRHGLDQGYTAIGFRLVMEFP